jgi:hypothetical protein
MRRIAFGTAFSLAAFALAGCAQPQNYAANQPPGGAVYDYQTGTAGSDTCGALGTCPPSNTAPYPMTGTFGTP